MKVFSALCAEGGGKMKKNLLTSLVLAGTLALGALTGCGEGAAENVAETNTESTTETAKEATGTDSGSKEQAQTETTSSGSEDKTIIVGATPVPHSEILDNIVKEVLAEDGW